jgi:hypothetical protein
MLDWHQHFYEMLGTIIALVGVVYTVLQYRKKDPPPPPTLNHSFFPTSIGNVSNFINQAGRDLHVYDTPLPNDESNGALNLRNTRKRISVLESLKEFSPSEQAVLKYISDYEVVTYENMFALWFRDSVFTALERGKRHGLVIVTNQPLPGHLGQLLVPRGIDSFQINPGVAKILAEIFDQEEIE